MSEYEGKYDPKDFTGRVIKPGDLVAYPRFRGGHLVLSAARVISTELREKHRYGAEHTVRAQGTRQQVKLLYTARMIVIDE